MNHWNFVIASYSVTLVATLALLLWAWRSMRRAERRADALRK